MAERALERLPIKLILPKQGREALVKGGGKGKQFRPVDLAYRSSLARQVDAIERTSRPLIERVGSAPLRVRLLLEAAAKSHRPDDLFGSETCPIIGAGKLGELFIKGTLKGLRRLEHQIRNNTSQRWTQQLSSVESIEVVTPAFRRQNRTPSEILAKSPRRDGKFIARVRLFDLGPEGEDQRRLVNDFESSCKSWGIAFSQGPYSRGTYSVRCKSAADLESVAEIVGVRTIQEMPRIRLVSPEGTESQPMVSLPGPEDVEGDYPIVAVVDSGVAPTVMLEPWVVGRQHDVSPEYRNPGHGTFVAGLICWGELLNPDLAASIDPHPCGVFDLEVLPNSDPEMGETDFVTEEELLQSLTSALKQHSNQIKVWNLSFGSDEVCSLDSFSAFAEELDKLQEQHQVTFVISAGNYSGKPLLDFPRLGAQASAGRITSPADSVLGITVGAISHIDYGESGPGANHLTPYSRHGAGPNYIIKPDLVHYGGTCATDNSSQSGLRSISGDGTIEDLGTSFSAPLVSRALAQVFHQVSPMPSPVLARALLTHHARDPRTGGRVPDGEENYFGFGRPAPVPECLQCTRSSATLVFEDQLRPGFYLEWDNFPFPPSLTRNGKYFGQISMTLAFAPSRSGRWGSEYCETHIDAHFGVYRTRVSRKTKKSERIFTGLVPPEHKNQGLLYETYQVEKLRKWAPVRTHFGDLGPKGERGESWRLMLRLLTRHDIERQGAFRPQPFALVITISDPNNQAPVYDEMAQIVRTRFQAENLAVRTAARIRSKT